jgi:hypothetical protein
MQGVAAGLVERGVSVLRFHFPYMERSLREGRRRPPDPTPVLLDACRAVVELANDWLAAPAAPRLVVGGKSMGGRMLSMLLAEEPGIAAGAVYLGYPLHPPGRPGSRRGTHLARVRVPQLFISGSRDALARLDLLRAVVEPLQAARLVVVEGADHSLAVSRRDAMAGSDAWLGAIARFIHEVAGEAGSPQRAERSRHPPDTPPASGAPLG